MLSRYSPSDLITIENETCISFRVIIITHFDPSESIKNHVIKNYYKPVNIKSGSFVGPGSIINPGVTIGENSFDKSGTIIFKDIHQYYGRSELYENY